MDIAAPVHQTLDAWLVQLELEEYADALRDAGYSTLRFLLASDVEEIAQEVKMKRPHARVFAQAWEQMCQDFEATAQRPLAAGAGESRGREEELVALVPNTWPSHDEARDQGRPRTSKHDQDSLELVIDEALMPSSASPPQPARPAQPKGFSAHTVFVNHETGEQSSPTLRLAANPALAVAASGASSRSSSAVFSNFDGENHGASSRAGDVSSRASSVDDENASQMAPIKGAGPYWAKLRANFPQGSRAVTEDGQVGVVVRAPAATGLQTNRVQLRMGDGSISHPIRIDAISVAPVPMFRMEDCTLLVCGIPDRSGHDDRWLREIFGEFGEFVAGSRRKQDKAESETAFGLVTFRNEYDVLDLLADAKQTVRPEAYNSRRGAGAKEVILRSFEADVMTSAEAKTWICQADSSHELRLGIGMPPAQQDRVGNFDDAWMASVAMAKENITDYRLFLAIDCARNLPAMDLNSGDPFARAFFVDPMADCEWHHQEPMEVEPEEPDQRRGCSLPCLSGPEVQDLPLFDGQHPLGSTSVESRNYQNPNFLWSLADDRVQMVPGISARGWLMIQLLDEDKWADKVIGQITINLDKVPYDKEVGGWYTVGSQGPDDTTLGVVQIRLLLSSHPQLADQSKAYLLEDSDVLQITQAVDSLVDVEFSDREMIRRMKADQARLQWRSDGLINRAFRTLDVDGGGFIDSEELGVIMALVGESLSALELGLMLIECKRWGGPSDQPAQIESLDLDDEDSGISRSEFKNMMTKYWTCRRFPCHDDDPESGKYERGLSTRRAPKVPYTSNAVLVTRGGAPVDEDDVMTIVIEKETGLCGSSTETAVPITSDLPPCPTWMTQMAKSHDRLEGDDRVGEVFWWFLSTRVEHVLTRADERGMVDAQGKIYDSEWRGKGNHSLSAEFHWSVRNIGSQDGAIPPSRFSIVWDLTQVVLLAYVLVSVPFALAFDVAFEPWTVPWIWEAFVDLYFVLDICLNFRTPYYSQGMLIDTSKEMAWRYMTSWGVPDLLSCASLMGYFVSADAAAVSDGSVGEAKDDTKASRLAKLVRLMKLAKLLRLARLKRSLARLADRFYDVLGGGILQAFGAAGSVLNLCLGFGLAMHLTSCVFYMIGTTDGWVDEVYDNEGVPAISVAVGSRYMRSMYIAALGALPGNTTPSEEVFAIFNVLVNGFVFGAVAATFSSIMVALNEPYAAFNSRMDELKTWMRSKRFNVAIQGQIEEFYAARLGGGSGGKVVDEASILEVFQPAPMADELIAMLYTETIKMVPMFSCLQNEVIAQLCLRLQNMPALQGAPVTVEGNVGKCMYIVNRGRLQKWKRATNVPVMARCALSSDRYLAYDVSLASKFWAALYDPVETDATQQRDMTAELEGLKMIELRRQMEAEGVTPEDIDTEMDGGAEKDSKKLAVKLCVERTSGGSIQMDQSGAETKPELQHRALDRQPTLMTGTCRHSSSHAYKTDVPIRRVRFFLDFDPTEGEAPDRVMKGDSVQVLEVRQGNVLSYLTDGDYTGEGCFLDGSTYRYEETTTAMIDSDLCFLLKSDLAEVKEEFPEVETSIQTVMNDKIMAEGPRRMFGEASGGDGDLSVAEMKELLVNKMHFAEDAELDQLLNAMDKRDGDGSGTSDEFEFAAWYRARHAAEQAAYREILSGSSLGVLVEWVTTARLEAGQLEECLDSVKPQAALVDKILSTPRLLELVHKDQQLERDYYCRYLERELANDSEYLLNRLHPEHGDWVARNPQAYLDDDQRQILQAVYEVAHPPASASVSATDAGQLVSEGEAGTSVVVAAAMRDMVDRALAQPSIIEELRKDEDEALARQAEGVHEPVDRLLFSTRAELNAIVQRGELAELNLGALHAYARENDALDGATIKEALQHEQPVARLIDAMVPMVVRPLHADIPVPPPPPPPPPLDVDADGSSDQQQQEEEATAAVAAAAAVEDSSSRSRFALEGVRQEIVGSLAGGELSTSEVVGLLNEVGRLQQELQQQLATMAVTATIGGGGGA